MMIFIMKGKMKYDFSNLISLSKIELLKLCFVLFFMVKVIIFLGVVICLGFFVVIV